MTNSHLKKASAAMARMEAAVAKYRAVRDDEIRAAAADGLTVREIAQTLGLSSARVHQILHGR